MEADNDMTQNFLGEDYFPDQILPENRLRLNSTTNSSLEFTLGIYRNLQVTIYEKKGWSEKIISTCKGRDKRVAVTITERGDTRKNTLQKWKLLLQLALRESATVAKKPFLGIVHRAEFRHFFWV